MYVNTFNIRNYLLQRKENTRLFVRRGATVGAEVRLPEDSAGCGKATLSASIAGIFRVHDRRAFKREVSVRGEDGRISSEGGLTSGEYRKGLGGYCRTVAVALNPIWYCCCMVMGILLAVTNVCNCCASSSLPANNLPRLFIFFGLAKDLDVFFLRPASVP